MQRGHIESFKRLFAQGGLFGAGPMHDPAGIKRPATLASGMARHPRGSLSGRAGSAGLACGGLTVGVFLQTKGTS